MKKLFTKTFDQMFETGVRTRASKYLKNNKIDILDVCDHECVALVEGSDFYEVILHWSQRNEGKDKLFASCNCPYYDRGEFCKHVWCLFLYLDRYNTDFAALRSNKVLLIHDQDEDEYDDYSYDLFDIEGKVGLASGNQINLSKGDHQSKSKNGEDPFELNWKGAFKLIERSDQIVESHENTFKEQTDSNDLNEQLWYFVNFSKLNDEFGYPGIEVCQRKLKKNGTWGKFKSINTSAYNWIEKLNISDAEENLIKILSKASSDPYNYGYRFHAHYNNSGCFEIDSDELWQTLLPQLCATHRFAWVHNYGEIEDLGNNLNQEINSYKWDNDFKKDWKLKIQFRKNHENSHWIAKGFLVREGEERSIDEIIYSTNRLVFFKDSISKTNLLKQKIWLDILSRCHNEIKIPLKDGKKAVEKFYRLSSVPELDIPEELAWACKETEVQPILKIAAEMEDQNHFLAAEIQFRYGTMVISSQDETQYIADPSSKQEIFKRDFNAERSAIADCKSLGLGRHHDNFHWVLSRDELFSTIEKLVSWGWEIKLRDQRIRTSHSFSGSINKSGVDWFELKAELRFEDQVLELPELLAAARENQNYITLKDGSIGFIPEIIKKHFPAMAGIGKNQKDTIKYHATHSLLLDSFLEQSPEIQVDQHFNQIRTKLKNLNGVHAVEEPKEFQGFLRPYQRQGLGWLNFLKEYGFGGCLADDMGLGKTVQVLAILQQIKKQTQNTKKAKKVKKDKKNQASLIVAPRSLVFNWIEETKKFTDLTVLDFSQTNRESLQPDIHKYDLVITTYAILRKEIEFFKDTTFTYAILDEAQAIKNMSSQAAKAARLLNSQYKLCLTGTPIENSLNDLWSLFSFINPGFLEHSSLNNISKFKANDSQKQSYEALAKAINPFILRRTKEEVLTDLPPKIEQVLYCELPSSQRSQYNKLKKYYRTMLDKQIKKQGFNQSKIQVLEALLRLRQAACHPGLMDKSLVQKPSAKVEILLEQLRDVVHNKRKALVFSQFTSMLAIVKSFLEKEGWSYEYLDGKTKNRQKIVDRFQKDDKCPIFLISLKAGGVGLNLTSADYCFILDPWWNPAVEAQAIDRAHRIGQTNQVYAYRLVAKDTVEERVLELQKTKKELADSIINENSTNLSNLTMEDLNLILS